MPAQSYFAMDRSEEYGLRKSKPLPRWMGRIPVLRNLWSNPVLQRSYLRSRVGGTVKPGLAFKAAFVFSLAANFLALLNDDPVAALDVGFLSGLAIPMGAVLLITFARMFIICLVAVPLEIAREFRHGDTNPIFTTPISTRDICYGVCLGSFFRGLEIIGSLLALLGGLSIPFAFFFMMPSLLQGQAASWLPAAIFLILGTVWLFSGLIIMMLLLSLAGGMYAISYPVLGAILTTMVYYLVIRQVADGIGSTFHNVFAMPAVLGLAQDLMSHGVGLKEIIGLAVRTAAAAAGCYITGQMAVAAFARMRRSFRRPGELGTSGAYGLTELAADDGRLYTDVTTYGIADAPLPPIWAGALPVLSRLWVNPIFQRRLPGLKRSGTFVPPGASFVFGLIVGVFTVLFDALDLTDESLIAMFQVIFFAMLGLLTIPLVFAFLRMLTVVPGRMMMYFRGEEPSFGAPLPLSNEDYLLGECMPHLIRLYPFVAAVVALVAGAVTGLVIGSSIHQFFSVPESIMGGYGGMEYEVAANGLLGILGLFSWGYLTLVLGLAIFSMAVAAYTLLLGWQVVSRALALIHTAAMVVIGYYCWSAVLDLADFRLGEMIHSMEDPAALFLIAVVQPATVCLGLWVTYRWSLDVMGRARRNAAARSSAGG